MYRNNEGYSDPTAGAALGRVMKETRKQAVADTDAAMAAGDARKERRKANRAVRSRPVAYVVSQYAGDVDRNVRAAIVCCRYVVSQGRIPLAVHLLYPRILNDSIPAERELGIQFGLALLKRCDEVWVFTRNGMISDGMRREIEEAKKLDKPVYHKQIRG